MTLADNCNAPRNGLRIMILCDTSSCFLALASILIGVCQFMRKPAAQPLPPLPTHVGLWEPEVKIRAVLALKGFDCRAR